jgi:hypothetical protein
LYLVDAELPMTVFEEAIIEITSYSKRNMVACERKGGMFHQVAICH